MNPFNGSLSTLFMLLSTFCTFGQHVAGNLPDTMHLTNGKSIAVNRTKVEGDLIAYERVTKKGKVKRARYLGLELVYSLSRGAQGDTILYNPSLPIYRSYSYGVEEMGYFILGQRAAKENHKTYWIFAGGAAFGGLGGYLLHDNIAVAAVPFAYSLGVGISVPKIDEVSQAESDALTEAFQLGYVKAAKSKRVFAALAGSLIGTSIGVATGYATN